jgi:hypothetical protein
LTTLKKEALRHAGTGGPSLARAELEGLEGLTSAALLDQIRAFKLIDKVRL